MRIQVLGQLDAERYCKTLNKMDGDDRYAVISIVSPSSRNADISEGGQIKNVFRMKFYDVEEDTYQTRYLHSRNKSMRIRYPAPTHKDMRGLKEFVDSLDDIDTLIIHCGAGISRSAGIASAVEKYLGMEDTIWCSDKYFPNRCVERVALEIFGISKDENYYSDIFSEQTKADDSGGDY